MHNVACVVAALRGIEEALFAEAARTIICGCPVEPAGQIELGVFGDALRANVEIPASIRLHIKLLNDEQVNLIVQEMVDEIQSWLPPAAWNEHEREWQCTRRDRMESIRRALIWSRLGEPGGFEFLAPLDALLVK